jgi:hypothetical protein
MLSQSKPREPRVVEEEWVIRGMLKNAFKIPSLAYSLGSLGDLKRTPPQGSLFSYKLEDKYKIYGEACNLPVEKNEAACSCPKEHVM